MQGIETSKDRNPNEEKEKPDEVKEEKAGSRRKPTDPVLQGDAPAEQIRVSSERRMASKKKGSTDPVLQEDVPTEQMKPQIERRIASKKKGTDVVPQEDVPVEQLKLLTEAQRMEHEKNPYDDFGPAAPKVPSNVNAAKKDDKKKKITQMRTAIKA